MMSPPQRFSVSWILFPAGFWLLPVMAFSTAPKAPTGFCIGAGCATSVVPVTSTAPSNPVTFAMTGSHATYNVGPGQSYSPNTMPWSTLQAGDVVNIFPNTGNSPYLWKFCLGAQGTSTAPVVINGVTDVNGVRPKFNFTGATTAADCVNVFNVPGNAYNLEYYGGIVVVSLKNNIYPPGGYKPSFIAIQNLELYGAEKGASFTPLPGGAAPAGGTAGQFTDAGSIWVQIGKNITIQNNIIHGSSFGIFTMTKDNTPVEMCENITLRNNYLYGNGTPGLASDHGVYMQSTNPLVEGNFFGQLMAGAQGSAYKSRSSGEIFRYNFVQAHARAIDWVQSEDSNPGIATQPDYGTDYAYGNIIVNDSSLPQGSATNPIHYGGDNCGEQANGAIPATTPASQLPAALLANCGHVSIYRSHLYFYNNTVVNNTPNQQYNVVSAFELSLVNTQVEAWDNIFANISAGQGGTFIMLDNFGQLNLRGQNLVYGLSGYAQDAGHSPLSAPIGATYSVNVYGNMLTGNPQFVNGGAEEFNLGAGSAALGQAGGMPTGSQTVTNPQTALVDVPPPAFAPISSYIQEPVTFAPIMGGNGLISRSNPADLGAH